MSPGRGWRLGAVVAVGGLAILLLGGVWLLRSPAALPARFADTDCRPLELRDAATGRAIVGIEDIARHGDSLFLSAHDRLAAAAAAGESGGSSAGGALYRLPIADLGRPGPLRLANQVSRRPGEPAFLLPHGIDAANGRLLAVDRRYGGDGMHGRQLLLFAIDDGGLTLVRRIRHPALCAANDVLLDDGEALVTLDRADCPGLSVREALFAPPSGRVLRFGLQRGTGPTAAIERQGLVFANGIARLRDPGDAAPLAVSETRARRISLGGGRRLSVPGGPDNLSVSPGGALVVALHPSLARLGLYLHGWTETAPSRIARVIPATGAVEILFDDPAGAILPGVTVALVLERRLVAGSVRAAGLMVCEPGR